MGKVLLYIAISLAVVLGDAENGRPFRSFKAPKGKERLPWSVDSIVLCLELISECRFILGRDGRWSLVTLFLYESV